MSFTYHHLDKWAYCNIDLVDEILETHPKALVLLSGASSSGKSYSAEILFQMLKRTSHHPLILSLDQYNVGLSKIIPRKANQHAFSGKIVNIDKLCDAIKPIVMKRDFASKYDEEGLEQICPIIRQFLNTDDANRFLVACNEEWKKLNFDEPSVYDLKEASEDIQKLFRNEKTEEKKYSKVVSERIPSGNLLNGADYDVILIEGIYALNENFIDSLSGFPLIRNFIDGNPKSLFLRRIIRDKTMTSADSPFTVALYFKYILKSYLETILPTRKNADVILNNDMTFDELRNGTLYVSKSEIQITQEEYSAIFSSSEILENEYQKDIFFNVKGENLEQDNILRLRCLSFDEGKTFTLSSLVHKGVKKTRFDQKIIRPINVLLKEGEVSKVFLDEKDAISSFEKAGFFVGKNEIKIKTKVKYQNRVFTLRIIDGKRYYLEFSDGDTILSINEIIALKDAKR